MIEMLTTHPPLHDCESFAALYKIGSPTCNFADYIPRGKLFGRDPLHPLDLHPFF